MNVQKYLERIGFTGSPFINEEVLIRIHEQHVTHIPFGNTDIYFKRKLSLEETKLFEKLIVHHRDGFCYELNYLFHRLLTELGFKSRMISCRIFTSEGFAGPEFDHMAVIVDLKNQWLLDVGFGDLFIRSLELTEDKIQFDGRNYFKIEVDKDLEYILSMSADGINFEKKYSFTPIPRSIADFESSCVDKQINPNSYFVQNTICTLPIPGGRRTIFNSKFIEKENEQRNDLPIEDENHLRKILKSKFGINA